MSHETILLIPRGFRASGRQGGNQAFGRRWTWRLLAADGPCAAAGTFTTNRICAAPVKWCRDRLPAEDIRAVVINSGNANAATGEQGIGQCGADRPSEPQGSWAAGRSRSCWRLDRRDRPPAPDGAARSRPGAGRRGLSPTRSAFQYAAAGRS